MALIRRPSLTFPRQWNPTLVPTFPVELDTAHPLSRALIHAQVYGADRSLGADFVGPALPFTVPGNAAYVAASLGPAVAVASGDSRQTINTPTGFPADDCDFSFRWLFEPSSVIGYNCLLRTTSSGGVANSGFYINGGVFDAYENGLDYTAGPTLPAGALTDIIFTKPAGSTTASVYINGVGYTFTTGSNFYLASATLAVWGDQYSQYLLGKRYQFLAWNRVLSSDEAAQLHAEPFAMLRPIVRRQYYMASAGVTPSAGAITGTSTVTGVGSSQALSTGSINGTSTASATGSSQALSAGAITAKRTFPRQWNPNLVPNFPVELDPSYAPTAGATAVFPLIPQTGFADITKQWSLPTFKNSNAIGFASTPVGPAISLNGSNQALLTTIPHPQVFSFAAWVYVTSTTNVRSIVGSSGTGGGGGGWQFRLENGTGQLGFLAQSQVAIGTSTSSIPASGLNFVGLSYDASGNYAFYINGSPAGSGNHLVTVQSGTLATIGSGDAVSGEYFNGSIASVCIFSRVLPPSAFAALAAAPFAMLRPIVHRQYYMASGSVTPVGTVTGTSTVTGIGSSQALATGTINGTSTVSATGSSNATGTGNIAANASVSGVGAANDTATGSITGTSTASATGQAQARATGSVTGSSSVSAIGSSNAISTGTINGSSTATASGQNQYVGSVTGTSTASAVGSSTAISTGSVTGISSVSATGSSRAISTGNIAANASVSGVGAANGQSTGSITGTSTSAATGQAQAKATGSVTGTSTASATGSSNAISTGTINGTSTITGFGQNQYVGSVTGTSTVSGVGTSQAISTGSVTGSSTVSGAASASYKATGSVTGSSSVTGLGSVAAISTGSVAGTSSSSASGVTAKFSTGSTIGQTNVAATAMATAVAIGSVSGLTTVQAIGFARAIATGAIQARATVTGVGISPSSAGDIAGICTVTGHGIARHATNGKVVFPFESRRVIFGYERRSVR